MRTTDLTNATTILFDLDGTLTDPAVGITGCIAYALEKLGVPVPPPEELRTFIGPPLHLTFAAVFARHGFDESRVDDAIALYRERFAPIGIYENLLYPGIPDALGALRAAGRTLYVATSKPHVFATEIVRHFGLSEYFQAIYGSELTGERTDKADLIAYLLDREGIAADQTVMIGDRRHDIEGARTNNLLGTIGVIYGYGGAAELLAAKATCLCRAPRDLPGLLVRAEPAEPMISPCVLVCTVDPSGVCIGCGRTTEEIAGWLGMTHAERRAVMDRLKTVV